MKNLKETIKNWEVDNKVKNIWQTVISSLNQENTETSMEKGATTMYRQISDAEV